LILEKFNNFSFLPELEHKEIDEGPKRNGKEILSVKPGFPHKMRRLT
jgi:hypothetical protein